LGYRQLKEFLKTESERLFPDNSGHIFNSCLAPSISRENLSRKWRSRSERSCCGRNRFLPQQNYFGSVSLLCRRVFSARDSARQKLNKLSESIFLKFFTLSVAWTAMENVRVLNFFGEWWNCLPLWLSVSRGVRVIFGTQLMRIR
jgi:hypothetical protein